MEFSWHWNQLQGTCAVTISRKPFWIGERRPNRQFGRRLRAHIGPQQARQFAHRIAGDGAALARFRIGIGDVLVGLLDALAALVELPAVIEAAQAGFLDRAAAKVSAAMRAVARDQAVAAAEVLVERQVLAEQPHRLDRLFRCEFAGAGDRHPVAPQQFAHGGACAHAGEHVVARGAQHGGRLLGAVCALSRRWSRIVGARRAGATGWHSAAGQPCRLVLAKAGRDRYVRACRRKKA